MIPTPVVDELYIYTDGRPNNSFFLFVSRATLLTPLALLALAWRAVIVMHCISPSSCCDIASSNRTREVHTTTEESRALHHVTIINDHSQCYSTCACMNIYTPHTRNYGIPQTPCIKRHTAMTCSRTGRPTLHGEIHVAFCAILCAVSLYIYIHIRMSTSCVKQNRRQPLLHVSLTPVP